MKRKKLLVIAYYLSKYNKEAVQNLGYKGFREAFNEIGRILDYSPNSVKNRRDDFDPLFEHRAGWHQVELNKDSLEVVNDFEHLSEESLRSIVLDILNNQSTNDSDLLFNDVSRTVSYTTRGITGKKAELFFKEWFYRNHPQDVLIDTRDLGCGYDFKIEDSEVVFEVKGLAGDDGGIQFTDKEWSVANSKKENYHLVLVKNCFSEVPEIDFYPNPSEKFVPKKQISTVINVNWGVSASDLRKNN